MSEIFGFWISMFSRVIGWVFDLVIIDNPKITLGVFLLSCAFIGFMIFFLFDSNFFLPFVSNASNKASNVVIRVRDKNNKSK